MKSKIIFLLYLSVFLSFQLPYSVAYDAPIDKDASWAITKYDVDAFLYIGMDSTIKITVINSTDSEVNVLLLSTDFVEEEPLIDYTDSRCFPFIVPPSFLNESNDLIEQQYQEELFGVKRTVAILIIVDAYIDEMIEADYILKYDLETGLLIEWRIVQNFEVETFETVLSLTETTFWNIEERDFWKDFYEANKYWMLPLIVIIIGIAFSYIVFSLSKTEKTIKLKFSQAKKVRI